MSLKYFLSILLLYCLRCCHDKPSKQEVLFPDFVTLIKSLINSKLVNFFFAVLVNFFFAVGCPSLAHSENKFHREGVPEF